jgi:hypothetical protein
MKMFRISKKKNRKGHEKEKPKEIQKNKNQKNP